MSKAGNFEIHVSNGGYPVWCKIKHNDRAQEISLIDHRELSDLKYAVEKAMQEVRLALPERYKDEV